MAADHPSAILAALRANANLATRVYDGPVPPGTSPPYVVVYSWTGRESYEKLAPVSNRTTWMTQTHSVGATAEAARIVARSVRTALLDQRMTVTGYQCSPILHESSYPPDKDESTGVLVMSQVDEWDYTARPV